MRRFVLDTNFFVNMEINSGFGKTSHDVVSGLVSIVRNQKEKAIELYIPPRIIREIEGFFGEEDYFKELLSVITVKSPTVSEINFPSSVFYLLVEDIRERSYRGLKVAEEVVEGAFQKGIANNKELDRKESQQLIGESIKTLRERYRQATRVNFLDSVADLDLIVLAKEIDASLVSSDEGLIKWGRLFGVTEVPAGSFRDVLLREAHLA